MKVCVLGLWHLGTVSAACLAQGGHTVVAIDDNVQTVEALKRGELPVNEPGLKELVHDEVQAGRLSFSSDYARCAEADILWVCYDTPVDENDVADIKFVEDRILSAAHFLKKETIIIVSSQVPVGFSQMITKRIHEALGHKQVWVAYSPENLRLGKAISIFTKPDRTVVGVPTEECKRPIAELLAPFTNNIIWMRVESAEMTKHALNSFLAVSVTFINEVAAICEQVGADAKEVEKGLKSEERIGPKAYLSPGGAFAGGTLARDVAFLAKIGKQKGLSIPLLSSIRPSNEEHKNWAARRLQSSVGELKGKTITILGLTYKPGTDTLRRSSAVELCQWLADQGSIVRAHDPAVKKLPSELSATIKLMPSVNEALKGAQAAVIATEWPEYRQISPDDFLKSMSAPLVLDANGFLRGSLGGYKRINYVAVGQP